LAARKVVYLESGLQPTGDDVFEVQRVVLVDVPADLLVLEEPLELAQVLAGQLREVDPRGWGVRVLPLVLLPQHREALLADDVLNIAAVGEVPGELIELAETGLADLERGEDLLDLTVAGRLRRLL